MSNPRITVYTAESSLRKPAQLARDMVGDLVAGRELAWQLAIRDIRAQYRQTALGLLWVFILPLANTAAWVFLTGAGIVSVGETDLPYPLYVFTGTMLWAIFTDALNAPLQQTAAARAMLTRVRFPREALLISGVYQTLFNGLIKILLLLGTLWLLGIPPDWGLIWLPLGILSLVMAGTALGLLLTPIGLLYNDIGRILPLLAQFLMYLTPVVFPVPSGGWAAVLYELNPLTPLILTCRNWLTGLPADYLGGFLAVNLGALLLLGAVWVVYRAAMPILIERMSA